MVRSAWESRHKASALAGAARSPHAVGKRDVHARPAVKNRERNYTMELFFSPPSPSSEPAPQPAGLCAQPCVPAWAPGEAAGGDTRTYTYDAPELRREGSHRSRISCSPACRPRWTQPRRMLLTHRRAKVRRGSWVQVKARGGREGWQRYRGGHTPAPL